MRTEQYPLLIPPSGLAERTPREWSPQQADEYLNWLTGVLEQRTDHLLAFFGETVRGNPETLLKELGSKVVEALRRPEFSEQTAAGPKLTDRGYAIAADMGLLVARLLLAGGNGSGQWAVLRQPRTDASYNHPVLTGLGPTPLEPVGGSIAEAYATLRGTRGSDAWQKIYRHWSRTNATAKP